MDLSDHFSGTELVCPSLLVRDGGVVKGMQMTYQCSGWVAEESKAQASKETERAYWQLTYFGPGVLKPFSL